MNGKLIQNYLDQVQTDIDLFVCVTKDMAEETGLNDIEIDGHALTVKQVESVLDYFKDQIENYHECQ